MLHSNHVRDYRNTFVIDCFPTITNVKSLAQRLKYARELRGLSQGELAKKAKCAQSTIGNVESGERANLRNLIVVARALNASPDWLYDGKGPVPVRGDAAYKPTGHRLTLAGQLASPMLGAADAASPWPFTISAARIMALHQPQRDLINAYIEGIVHGTDSSGAKRSSGA